MKILFALLIIFHCSFTDASSISLAQREGIYHLVASSCEILERESEIICQSSWQAHSRLRTNNFPRDCFCEDSLCHQEIQSCIPENLLSLHQTRPLASGPNCWGAALYTQNHLAAPISSSNTLFELSLLGPLCRERGAKENPHPGDIIRILSRGIENPSAFVETHGFVQLGEQLCFSKNGMISSASYQILPCQSVYQLYQVPANCQNSSSSDLPNENLNATSNEKQNCSRVSINYQCQSLEAYQQSLSASDEIRETQEIIENLESLFSQVIESSPFIERNYVIDEDSPQYLILNSSRAIVTQRLSEKQQQILALFALFNYEVPEYLQSNDLLNFVRHRGVQPHREQGLNFRQYYLLVQYLRLKELEYEMNRLFL